MWRPATSPPWKTSLGDTDIYRVILSPDARRFFVEATASLQRRLDRYFDQLKIDPHHHPNIRPLKGRLVGRYRYRVGDYRVVYRIDDTSRVVTVLLIAHRREVYH